MSKGKLFSDHLLWYDSIGDLFLIFFINSSEYSLEHLYVFCEQKRPGATNVSFELMCMNRTKSAFSIQPGIDRNRRNIELKIN